MPHCQAVVSQSYFPDSFPIYTARCCRSCSRSQLTANGPKGLIGKTVQQSQAKKKLRSYCKVCMFAFSIDASSFSSFEASLHVSVLCCRFLPRIRKAKSPTGLITVTDLRVAKTKWLRYVQQNDCGMVMTALSQKQPHQLTSN